VIIDHVALGGHHQAICFPIYRLETVRRADYLVCDRHHLSYLNALEKLNCAYCSYANGLIAYVGEIAARAEGYWCPIKHARRLAYAHRHYTEFSDHGDAEAYRKICEAPQMRSNAIQTADVTPSIQSKGSHGANA
jgi:hypothetical protein